MEEKNEKKTNETNNLKVTIIDVYGIPETQLASGFPMLEEYDERKFFNDLGDYDALMKADGRLERLAACKGGESHDCCLCGIIAQFNLTAPRYFWQEWQRYHFQDIVSSMSTMHRIKSILSKAVELRSKIEKTGDENDIKYCDFIRANFAVECDIGYLEDFFINANYAIEQLDEIKALRYIKANLPEGLKLTARITTNYRQLKTIYHQRHNHRLAEWRTFCNYYLNLFPHKNLIMGE